ncbi:MAG: PepSY domain-containing protein [Colwellia sp.]|nr:PepSY domain-containing protein [Colwellia sp.]
MKKKLHQWHSYGALIAMFPLLLISITGSILVFKVELDTLLMPEKMAVAEASPTTRLSLDTLMSKVKAYYPNHEIGSWEIFTDNHRTDTAYIIAHHTNEWSKLYLNQYTGELLSTPVGLSDNLTDWLLDLHFKLLLDANGIFLGAIVSILLLFLGISGMVLYRRFWRYFFTLRVKAASRIFFSDIHKMIGIASSPVIIILAFTGAYWNITEVIHEVEEHVIKTPHILTKALHNKDISLQALYESNAKTIADFEATYLLMPYDPEMNITFYGKINTSNPLNSNYASSIHYDKNSAEVVSSQDVRNASVVHVTVDSFRKLHFGHFAGLASKLVWCLLGLSPVILALTGLYLFWHRRRKRVTNIRSFSKTAIL